MTTATELKDQVTRIYGYEVTLEFIQEGSATKPYVVSSCIINKKVRGKEQSASLCFLENNGCFSSDETVEVPQHVIDAISTWAGENGY